jgi:predicted PurR-regulated permease PerM
VIGIYIVIQQIEGNVIMPLIQRRAAHVPPVLTLFAVLVFGLLFGTLGVLLGSPLAVVLYVAVRELYLQDSIDEQS